MLNVTDRATAAMKTVMSDEFVGLRIMVISSGCSGFSYKMGLESEIMDDDQVLEFDGIKVLVDPSSTMWLTGATMDYVDSGEGSGFVFENPNQPVKSSSGGGCSCSSKSC